MLFHARKIIAVALVFLLLMQAGGMGWMRAFTHFQIKNNIRNAIQEGKALAAGQTFYFACTGDRVTQTDFLWEEEGEEFLYKGIWYDVLSLRKEAGQLVIQAIQDGDDTQLAATWKLLQPKKSDSSPMQNGTLAKFFAAFIPTQIPTFIFFKNITPGHPSFFTSYIPLISSENIDRPPCLA
jgi:hypothetical protein